MINVVCLACRRKQKVNRLGIRCRACRSPQLRQVRMPARKPKPARTPLGELPSEGRKLRRFLDAMGWTEEIFAQRVTHWGRGRIGRSYVSALIHGRKGARYGIARAIASIMSRNGHTPAVFYPGVTDTRHPKKPVRHDWFAWQQRRKQ